MALEGQAAGLLRARLRPQLEWVSPVAEWAVENADVRIAVMASQNTRALSAGPARAPGEDAGRDGSG